MKKQKKSLVYLLSSIEHSLRNHLNNRAQLNGSLDVGLLERQFINSINILDHLEVNDKRAIFYYIDCIVDGQLAEYLIFILDLQKLGNFETWRNLCSHCYDIAGVIDYNFESSIRNINMLIVYCIFDINNPNFWSNTEKKSMANYDLFLKLGIYE